MERLPLPLRLVIITILGFAAAESQAHELPRPSETLLRAVPEFETRLHTEQVTECVQILNLLVDARRSGEERGKLRVNLPRSDYVYVLGRCLRALKGDISEQDAAVLLSSAPRWVDVIRRFELNEITEQIAHLIGSKNLYVQFFALEVLTALDARQYEVHVAKLLVNEQREVQRAARTLLLKWNSKALIPMLLEDLKSGNDFQRFQAIEAIGRIGDPKALPALLQCGSDPHENNRWAALKVARKLVPAEDLLRLLAPMAREIAQNSTNPEAVDYALSTAVDCGDSTVVPAVMERLTSTDEGMRERMHRGLEGMSVKVLAEAASAALIRKEEYGKGAPNQHVRAGLVGILERVGTHEVVPALRSAAADPDRFINSGAMASLGRLKAGEATEDLITALKGPSARDAAIALARIRNRRSLNALKLYLEKKGVVDSNFIYFFNEAYNEELDRKLKRTRLKHTVEAPPDELLSELERVYDVLLLKVSVEAQEWAEAARSTGAVSVYPEEDLNNSIGRALNYINAKGQREYCRVLRNQEVHIMRLDDAPQFIIGMFETDFR